MMRSWLTSLLIVFASQSGVPAEVRLTQAHRDSRTGLTIRFPAGWVLDAAAPGFAVVDFPLDKRPPQVLVPLDRAEIGVFPPPEGEESIAEWMRKERISEGQGDRVSQLKLSTKSFGVLEVTVVREEPRAIPEGTLVLFFFEIGGRPIKASLIYRGRGRAAYFENVFNAMIQNLEPLPAR